MIGWKDVDARGESGARSDRVCVRDGWVDGWMDVCVCAECDDDALL